MELTKIVQGVNTKLAGELLPYEMMRPYLDEVIDDINDRLCANFPVFSDFTQETYPTKYPNYDFFPDRYIRKVVMYGAAYKFYTTDEEGINSAKQYQMDYSDALFLMERDYIDQIPVEFQANTTGSVIIDETGLNDTPFSFTLD